MRVCVHICALTRIYTLPSPLDRYQQLRLSPPDLTPPNSPAPRTRAPERNDLKVLRFVGSTHGQTSWHLHKSERVACCTQPTCEPPPRPAWPETLTPYYLPLTGHTHLEQPSLTPEPQLNLEKHTRRYKHNTNRPAFQSRWLGNSKPHQTSTCSNPKREFLWCGNPTCCALQPNKLLLMRW